MASFDDSQVIFSDTPQYRGIEGDNPRPHQAQPRIADEFSRSKPRAQKGVGGGSFSGSAKSTSPSLPDTENLFEEDVGANVQGIADMINQAADRSIARVSQGVERSQQQVEQSFTQRGLRRSGLASGAVQEVQDQAMRQQQSIDTNRMKQLSQLGRQAVQNRAQKRLEALRLKAQQQNTRMRLKGQRRNARLSARLNAPSSRNQDVDQSQERTRLSGVAFQPGIDHPNPFGGSAEISGDTEIDLNTEDLYTGAGVTEPLGNI